MKNIFITEIKNKKFTINTFLKLNLTNNSGWKTEINKEQKIISFQKY